MSVIPKIAIIGAGPAGLTLARLLHMSSFKTAVTLYELDASPSARVQRGGCLDLHADTGLAAIRKCGLWDAFSKYARYDGQEFIIADKNWTELVHVGGGKTKPRAPDAATMPDDRPEIDRESLKEILLESVPEESVSWGRKLREVTEDGMLRFDGREELEGPFDLVVGADGAWSKVRTRLTDVQPTYSGVSGYEMEIMEPAKTCPHVHKMVGKGSFGANSDRKFMNGQRMGDGSIKVRSWYQCPEGEAKEDLDRLGNEGVFKKIMSRYEDWAPEIKELFHQADLDGLHQWTLYELPVGHKWEHKKGLTLIGDAASLMSPFGGEGVNKAMKDSLELAEMIEKSQDPKEEMTLDQAILQYEQKMFPRAEKVQQATMDNKLNAFGPDAPIAIFTGLLKSITSKSPSTFIQMLGTAPFVGTLYSYLWIRQRVGWAVRRYWRRT